MNPAKTGRQFVGSGVNPESQPAIVSGRNIKSPRARSTPRTPAIIVIAVVSPEDFFFSGFSLLTVVLFSTESAVSVTSDASVAESVSASLRSSSFSADSIGGSATVATSGPSTFSSFPSLPIVISTGGTSIISGACSVSVVS